MDPPKAEPQAKRLKKDHTAIVERADVAAQNFAATSGLTEVFCALNLSADVHEQCLARTVQWFQDVGVRSRNTSRHCTTIATMARASPSGWLRIPCAARRGSHGLKITSARLRAPVRNAVCIVQILHRARCTFCEARCMPGRKPRSSATQLHRAVASCVGCHVVVHRRCRSECRRTESPTSPASRRARARRSCTASACPCSRRRGCSRRSAGRCMHTHTRVRARARTRSGIPSLHACQHLHILAQTG